MRKSFVIVLCLLICGNTLAQRTYTLRQVIDFALHNNIVIRNARNNMDIAKQQREEAFTKYFPDVSADGLWFNANKGMAKTSLNPSEVIPSSISSTLGTLLPAEALSALASPIDISMIKNGTIANVTAVQPVFAGGRIINGNKLAKVGEETSRLQLRLAEKEVEMTAEQYYWQIISLQEKMNTLAAAEDLLNDIYKDVNTAVNAGVALRNDLLQVQLRQNEMKSQKLKLQNGISVTKMIMAQYCGLRDTSFTLSVNHDIPPTLPPRPDTKAALVTVTEYQLLNKKVEATKLQKDLAIGQTLPTIAVGAGYTYHNLLDNNHSFGMVFATVSIPVSGWWSNSHTIKRKTTEYKKSVDEQHDKAELLQIRMENAWNNVNECFLQLEIARQSTAQAEENLRINRNLYRAGTVKMADLLQAQLLYQQSLNLHTDAYADYQAKLSEYRLSIGQ